MGPHEAERVLLERGLLRREGTALFTTRRWQAAMMRAAARLVQQGRDGDDLRVPIAAALLELMPEASDADIAGLVAVLAPLEAAEMGASSPPAGPAST